MKHVIRHGGSMTAGTKDHTRVVALIATFLLLSAGMVVSAPGLMSASATSRTSTNQPGSDDGTQNGGGDDCHSEDDSGSDNSSDDHSSDDQSKDDQSKDDQSSTDQSGDLSVQSVTAQSTDSSSDDSQSNSTDDGHDESHDDSQDNGHDDGHHETHGDDDDDENCTTTTTADLTLNKVVVNDSNGTATVADFTLVATSSVGGVDVISGPDPVAGSPVGISATVPVSDTYVLSEVGPDGYQASPWSCSAGTLNGDTLTLVAGDVANCTITNDDIASLPATITVDKFVAAPVWGGTLVAGDFQLTIDGVDAAQAIAHDVSPGLHTIGESPARPGYELVGTVCTDLDTSAQLSTDGTVTVVAGQNV
ncbi:MAG: large repetitive protein, partial [Ilumatobacteraceae bacterium]